MQRSHVDSRHELPASRAGVQISLRLRLQNVQTDENGPFQSGMR